MREIIEHRVAADDPVKVFAADEPGPGGANHLYVVCAGTNNEQRIAFQNGPIGEVGANGLSNEALLAIVLDRLRAFQEGPYACPENSYAMDSAHMALDWLNVRTRERVSRKVEGTSKV